jgi:hypothetical protein
VFYKKDHLEIKEGLYQLVAFEESQDEKKV